jgi:hypothetical protein
LAVNKKKALLRNSEALFDLQSAARHWRVDLKLKIDPKHLIPEQAVKPLDIEWGKVEIRSLFIDQLGDQLPGDRSQRHAQHGMTGRNEKIIECVGTADDG